MLAKNSPVQLAPALQKQLELLYARRVAVDSLIRSLVDYDRLRAKTLQEVNRKTA
jgi:hypothetical protein